MARIKYYYDTETCKYERVKVTTWDVSLNLMGFLAVAMILAIGIVMISSAYFEPPKEALLRKDNEELLFHNSLWQKELKRMQQVQTSLQIKDDDVYRIIFEAEPIPSTIRNAGVGGTERYKDLVESDLEREKLIIENYKKIDKLKKQMYIQSTSYDEIMEMAANKGKLLASRPAIQPVANKELKRLASGYGMRIHPILKKRKMHWGLDYSAPKGTPIYATGDGVIGRAVTSIRRVGYGNMIEIDHGFGFKSRYGHMQSFTVKVGQKVKRGDCIGYVGNTGGSVGPHCHYEILKRGKKVDPVNYIFQDLTDEEYEKLLELASVENRSLG